MPVFLERIVELKHTSGEIFGQQNAGRISAPQHVIRIPGVLVPRMTSDLTFDGRIAFRRNRSPGVGNQQFSNPGDQRMPKT